MDKKLVLKPTSLAYHFILREFYSGKVYHHVDGLKMFVNDVIEYISKSHCEVYDAMGDNLKDKSVKNDFCDEIIALAKFEDDKILYFPRESVKLIKEEFKKDTEYKEWMVDFEKFSVYSKYDNDFVAASVLEVYSQKNNLETYDTTNVNKDDDLVC